MFGNVNNWDFQEVVFEKIDDENLIREDLLEVHKRSELSNDTYTTQNDTQTIYSSSEGSSSYQTLSLSASTRESASDDEVYYQRVNARIVFPESYECSVPKKPKKRAFRTEELFPMKPSNYSNLIKAIKEKQKCGNCFGNEKCYCKDENQVLLTALARNFVMSKDLQRNPYPLLGDQEQSAKKTLYSYHKPKSTVARDKNNQEKLRSNSKKSGDSKNVEESDATKKEKSNKVDDKKKIKNIYDSKSDKSVNVKSIKQRISNKRDERITSKQGRRGSISINGNKPEENDQEIIKESHDNNVRESGKSVSQPNTEEPKQTESVPPDRKESDFYKPGPRKNRVSSISSDKNRKNSQFVKPGCRIQIDNSFVSKSLDGENSSSVLVQKRKSSSVSLSKIEDQAFTDSTIRSTKRVEQNRCNLYDREVEEWRRNCGLPLVEEKQLENNHSKPVNVSTSMSNQAYQSISTDPKSVTKISLSLQVTSKAGNVSLDENSKKSVDGASEANGDSRITNMNKKQFIDILDLFIEEIEQMKTKKCSCNKRVCFTRNGDTQTKAENQQQKTLIHCYPTLISNEKREQDFGGENNNGHIYHFLKSRMEQLGKLEGSIDFRLDNGDEKCLSEAFSRFLSHY